jgi:hypothetical protein
MTWQGSAFLAMWNDVAPAGEADFDLWHTREHMPERVGVPGFLVGRRYVNWSLGKYRYFTAYEGSTLGVFNSPAYLARLNAPTQWSKRIQPYFLNFLRAACRTVASTGLGVGGALLTARIEFTPGGTDAFVAFAAHAATRISALDGVTAVHVGVADPSITRVKTAETELKERAGESVFDGVVLVEGIGRRELDPLVQCVGELLTPAGGVASAESAVYDLAYLLTAESESANTA